MRVRIDTLGCRVNRYDSAVLRGELAARGYEVVEEGAPYDVYLVNTCTVTHAADAEARGLLGRARRTAPQARLVVTGCWAETAAEEVRRLPVDLVVGNRDKPTLAARLDALLGAQAPAAPVPPAEPFPDPGGATRFFFKIQEGCDVRCSFCIIPDARGPARSLPVERVLATVAGARARGFAEVVLSGIHLGAWGRDLPGRPTLAGLCRRILDETDLPRLRLGSLEPWGVRPALLALFGDQPRFLPMLHLPLQSGSEPVLRRMRRPITAGRYLEVVRSLLEARPDLAIWLDVLVGFPGETDAEFAETLELLARFPWTRLHVFPYSPRRGTPAAALSDPVPVEIRRARVRTLVDLSEARFSARMGARVGSTDEVLVERAERGHTRDHFPCRLPGGAPGAIVPVRLVGLAADGAALEAAPLAPSAGP